MAAGTVPQFDEKLESWECYQERLEHYFTAADIVDQNKKKAILLNSVGPGTYERVRNICFPSSVNDTAYGELLEVFSQLFSPSIVIFKERKEFYNARKGKNEKASAWHERICRLAKNCKFGLNSEEVLRDKFVTSFDGTVFEKFCDAGLNLALPEALEIAKVYETLDVGPKPGPKCPPQKFSKENPTDKKYYVKKEGKPHKVAKETPQETKQDQPKEGAKPKRAFIHTQPKITNITLNNFK